MATIKGKLCPRCKVVHMSDHDPDGKWLRCKYCGYCEKKQTPPP